jgi:hypothetical protein
MHIKMYIGNEENATPDPLFMRASRFPDLFLALGETLTAWKIIPCLENLFPSATRGAELSCVVGR